jgi:predicted enzyme related to lactoylglutathione lyase
LNFQGINKGNQQIIYIRKYFNSSKVRIILPGDGVMDAYDNYFLGAEDIEKSRKFYENILGLSLKFDFSDKGMVAFKVGSEEPAIILKDLNKFPEVKPTVWFVVEDVETEYQKLKGKGVNFLSEPFEILTGMAVEFEDPSGNKLGITDYTKQPDLKK